MVDDDDTNDGPEDGAADECQRFAFDAAELTSKVALAPLLSLVTDRAARQMLVVRWLGRFASLANLMVLKDKELLAFDGMKPQGAKLLCT